MEPVLELRNIVAGYGEGPVLRGLSLSLPPRRIVGLVGESGSGKSTVARVAAGLLRPESGEVLLNGRALSGRRSKADARRVQMVFQNPEGSLNPKHRIGRTLSEAMLFHGVATRADAREKCRALIGRMELPPDTLDRFPRSFSGRQKQRIALARALCVGPELLIADEPTSSLDVSVQLKMLDLIRALRAERELTILFISHDLGVVRSLCDEVAVMQSGRIVEQGETEAFFSAPATDCARRLIDSVPRIRFDEAAPWLGEAGAEKL